MNQQRLRLLAARLREPDVEPKFDLVSWCSAEFRREPKDVNTAVRNRLKTKCGTTACAIGYACLMPAFQTEGLGFYYDAVFEELTPRYGGMVSWDAVERFFEISEPQAHQLFAISSYPSALTTAADVANRIDKFIAKKGKI